ncbi:membrane protein insertion efficiency factor YidD [Candidatus Berkelbacteria bacterium]|nr:membrane protein insertion efficiency factor YidD [Candidatus Berkelbacteria bacterium]MBI2588504.1 membrane protein insertion efficiency factor YidD [Candidatus Berkelbacteria bacterium]
MVKKIFLGLILVYQAWRRLFRPFFICRFEPSCSEYAYQAILKKGAFLGFWQGLKRILRCHPWSRGGFDPAG